MNLQIYRFPLQQQITRHLNLLEFQSKDLLRKFNVAVQQFKVVDEGSIDQNNPLQQFGNFLKKTEK